jgi:hypothetical protein
MKLTELVDEINEPLADELERVPARYREQKS